MRDYKLVSQRVLQRRDEYLLARKHRKKIIYYTVIPVSFCVLLAISTVYQNFIKNSSDELQIIEQESQETTDFYNFDALETESQAITSNFKQSDEQQEFVMTNTESNFINSDSVSETEFSLPVTEPTELITDNASILETNATSVSMTEIATKVTNSNTMPNPTTITEQTESNSIMPSEMQQPSDYRITVDAFEPTPEQLSQVVQQTVPSNFEHNYTTLEQLFQDTGATILCKVLSVINTIRDNKPYTVYTVEVTESVYGSFVAGDLLSIVQYGGYVLQDLNEGGSNSIEPTETEDNISYETIPTENVDLADPELPPQDSNMCPDYTNNSNLGGLAPAITEPQETTEPTQFTEILIKEQLAYSETPDISQEYVLFISEDNLFSGAYTTLNQNEGIFKVNPETGELIRNAEQGEEINSVSYETIKEISQNFVNSTN